MPEQRWEYLEVVVSGNFVKSVNGRKQTGSLENWFSYLTEVGKHGWELIIKAPYDSRMNDGSDFTATLKRPL